MLRQTIKDDQIKALKAHDQLTLNTLRYILAQIKNKEIEKRAELTDDEVISVLRKQTKELHESIEAFKKGERNDLVTEYEKQLQITSSYLPKEISDDELKKEIERIMAENKELQQKNPKALIGIAMKQLKNKAGSARILKILNSHNF